MNFMEFLEILIEKVILFSIDGEKNAYVLLNASRLSKWIFH